MKFLAIFAIGNLFFKGVSNYRIKKLILIVLAGAAIASAATASEEACMQYCPDFSEPACGQRHDGTFKEFDGQCELEVESCILAYQGKSGFKVVAISLCH